VGHVAQALQCLEGGVAAGRADGGASLCQASGTTAEMRETGWALVAPVLLDAVAIADRDALPIFAQGPKGRCGTVGIKALVRHLGGGHDPEPWQGVLAVPWRCITVAHRGLVGQSRHGRLGGPEGVRDAWDDFLYRAQAAGDGETRVPAVWDEAPRGALPAGAFAAPGTQARAITGLRVTGPLRFALPAPSLAEALVQEAVVALQLDGRHRADLLGVVGRQGHQVALATGPGAGLAEMDCRGAEHRGPVATVTLLATAFAGRGLASALGLVAG
jgi:hypothetical protein